MLEFGGIATVWDVLVDGRSWLGRSAFERPVVDLTG